MPEVVQLVCQGGLAPRPWLFPSQYRTWKGNVSNGRQQMHSKVPLALTDAYDNQTHQREKEGRDYSIGSLVLIQPDLIS